MRKGNIQNIVVHIDKNADKSRLVEKVSQFHIEIIERKLANSNLTKNEKIAVIDKIMEDLKSREVNNVIR